MRLSVLRKKFSNASTLGDMAVEGMDFCHTLELPWNKGLNLPNENCILPGIYTFTVEYSPSHKCLVPLLQGVVGRSAVELHIGNYPRDVKGCLAVGFGIGNDSISFSTDCFKSLMIMLKLREKEQHTIEIRNSLPS